MPSIGQRAVVGAWYANKWESKRVPGGGAHAPNRTRGGDGRIFRKRGGRERPRRAAPGCEARCLWRAGPGKGRRRERGRVAGSASGDGASALSRVARYWERSREKGRSLAVAKDRPGGMGERYGHTLQRMTGMPSVFALSTRFPVMPLPGNAITPLGSRFRSPPQTLRRPFGRRAHGWWLRGDRIPRRPARSHRDRTRLKPNR